jgi:hypothetical protein
MQRGQVPIADFLCALCLHHRRVTGRQLVRDFLASDPIAVHRTTCTATSERPVTRIDGAPNPKE